jgi:hypothetical protein
LFVLNELQEFLIFWRLAIKTFGRSAELDDLNELNAREAGSGASAMRRKPEWEKVMGSCEAP